MSDTPDSARDKIMGAIVEPWSVLGYPIVFTDVPGETPSTQTPWARVILRHAVGGQASLSGPINGCVRHNNEGTVYVQVFAPIGDGSTTAYEAASVVKNALEDFKDSNVWFRRVRINEVGTRGAFEQINVLADFTYDETR